MSRYVRLWVLLFVAFTGVFALFVNHDLLVYWSDEHIWVKEKVHAGAIAFFSAMAGLILASVMTGLHALGELVFDKSRRPPDVDLTTTASPHPPA